MSKSIKRWIIMSAAVVMAVWFTVDAIRDFRDNETIAYFTSAPYCLLYVAGIALGGGFAALIIVRLRPAVQRQLKLFAWGAATTLTTVSWCFMLYTTVMSSAIIVTNIGAGSMTLILIFWGALAGYSGFEFYRSWKARFSP